MTRAIRRRGMSLVEAIAVIVVLSILGSGTAGLLMRASSGYAALRDTASAHTEVSAAMERIVRELREMPIETDPDGSPIRPAIVSASESGITFGSGRVLTLVGDRLTWSEDGGASTWDLLTDVRSVQLTCLRESGDAIPVQEIGTEAVHSIVVSIEAGDAARPVRLRTTVFLRANLAILGSNGA